MTRRDLSLVLPVLGVLVEQLGLSQTAGSGATDLSHSAGFAFDQLPLTHSTGGAITRPVVKGKLPTGEMVEMHETTLDPGQMPHPAHKHVHCEFMLIREGTVEFRAADKAHQLGPGGVAYAASGEMHSLLNTGVTPANYFVIAIGMD